MPGGTSGSRSLCLVVLRLPAAVTVGSSAKYFEATQRARLVDLRDRLRQRLVVRQRRVDQPVEHRIAERVPQRRRGRMRSQSNCGLALDERRRHEHRCGLT